MTSKPVRARAWVLHRGTLKWAAPLPFALVLLVVREDGATVAKMFALATVLALVLANMRRPGRKLGDITHDREALHIDGDMCVPTAEIDDVGIVPIFGDRDLTPKPIEFEVRIRTWAGTQPFAFDHEREASTFADRVRANWASSSRARFVPADARVLRWVAPALLVAGMSLVLRGSAWAALAAILAGVVAFATASTPIAVRVTPSWFLLQRFGRVRRFARDEIARFSVTHHPAGKHAIFTLHLRDGRRIALRQETDSLRSETEGIEAIARELDGSGVRSAVDLPPEAERVRRRGRDIAAWLEELEALSRVEPTYRAAALHDDGLWQVLDDPSAPDDARLGAAVVLRHGPEARIRIAAAAAASGDAKVRVALETLATEDADVERALAACARIG